MSNNTTPLHNSVLRRRANQNESTKYITASSIKNQRSKHLLVDTSIKSKRPQKYTAPNDLKLKIRNNKILEVDPIIHSPEFQFLYKLFVPSKVLLKSEQISIKQLSNHLPRLIDSEAATCKHQLNFQLHLFLATIMDRYIASWYLTKLNTDNYKFLELVYMSLCDLVRDFYRRTNDAFTNHKCVDTFKGILDILTSHLEELVPERDDEYGIKFVNDYFTSLLSTNTIKDSDINITNIVNEFLSDNHVIFQSSLESIRSLEGLDSNEISYYRLLAKLILISSNETSDNSLLCVVNSPIILNLVVVLVGDLVLKKIVDKLSSPEFILGIINKTFISLNQDVGEEKKEARLYNNISGESKRSLIQRIKCALTNVYNNVNYFFIYSFDEGSSDLISLIESSFRLIDTITGISERKSLLCGVTQFMGQYLLSFKYINSKVNALGQNYILNRLKSSSILTDAKMASIVSQLRDTLFENSSQDESQEIQSICIDDILSNIFNGLSYRDSNKTSWKYGLNSLMYKDESDDDIKESISRFLGVFNNEEDYTESNIIHKLSKLNKLLIIRILDYLLSQIYPELVN